MSDYDLPELPSDEELGITEDDRRSFEGREDSGESASDAPGSRTDERRPSAEPRDGKEPRGGGPAPWVPAPGWRGPVTLLLMVVLALFASPRTGQMAPEPANAPDTAFSSTRAMALLTDIARRPRPTGAPEHARVRDVLVQRLRDIGLEPEVQTATTLLERRGSVSGDPALARAATVRNVVARISGANSSGTVLVTAHYDSRGIAVGAGDDGSGVVTILEALRALTHGPTPRNDIVVLLTDAEELGLLGARAFVEGHPWMPEVDVVLSFEMMGGSGPSIMFETNDRNGWIIPAFRDFASKPVAYSLSYDVYRRMPRDTDFSPFRDAGVQGLNFAAIGNGHIYHQVYDVPDHVSSSTIQHHGNHALAGLRYLGDADLTSVNDSDVVFFTVPGLGLVVYDAVWVVPLALLLIVGFGLLALAARRAGARTSRVVAGTLAAVAMGAAAYVSSQLLFGWLTGLHPEYGALAGAAFHGEGWYVLAIVSIGLLLVTGVTTLTRRWIAPLELAIGALIVPLVAAVASSFVAPLAAANLQWPVAAAILSTTFMALLGARASGLVGWVVFLVLAVPVFVLLQPVLELVWLALSLELAGGIAVIAVIGFLLCAPLLPSLTHPNRLWAPLTFGAIAALSLGTGIVTSGPSPEGPAPSTLLYAHEHGTDAAVWATDPGLVEEGGSSEAETDPGRAWARERVGRSFDTLLSLEDFLYLPDRRLTGPVEEVLSRPMATAPARVALVEPPAVDVATDTVIGDTRRVVLRVRSRIGAEMLAFELAGRTRLTAINGDPVSNVDALRWIDHWGAPEDAVVLEISVPSGSPLELHVVEHHLRPEEILGRDAFRRPPELAPDVTRLSDRALFRSAVPVESGALGSQEGLTSPAEGGAPEASPAQPDSGAAPGGTLRW